MYLVQDTAEAAVTESWSLPLAVGCKLLSSHVLRDSVWHKVFHRVVFSQLLAHQRRADVVCRCWSDYLD